MDWIKCTEESYPDNMDKLLFAYKLDKEEKEWTYCTFNDMPYGWNVLCHIESYYTIIEEPKIE